jgi:hypothetical protein
MQARGQDFADARHRCQDQSGVAFAAQPVEDGQPSRQYQGRYGTRQTLADAGDFPQARLAVSLQNVIDRP